MKRFRLNSFWLSCLLNAAPGGWAALHAQETATVPPPTAIKSPVDTFRELLALTPAERRQAIANRPPEDQKRILAKIREYESLKPDARELRLRSTELHWYLLPLLNASTTDRAAQLALVPADTRKLVEDRLQTWDRLKPELQKELLANEQAMRWYVQLESSPRNDQQTILADMSPARRRWLEEDLARIRALPPERRRELADRFNQFFDLTPKEKDKALQTLSEVERQQMARTLRAFGNLPEAQREQCLEAFQKFTSMSLAERQQFLKNADLWRRMKPEDRQAWRDLVSKVPDLPPPPPGLQGSGPFPPFPPMSAATNSRAAVESPRQ